VSPDSSFNTAVSFATNTNWQGYVGEATMSYLTQMLGLAVQNFLSAASGMAVLVALIRGFARRETDRIGNFYVDLTRTTLYILLPLSLVLAVVLMSQGVVQSFGAYRTVSLLDPVTIEVPVTDANGEAVVDAAGEPVMEEQVVTEQTLPLGPAASQIAIKQLGTNGGGFFNVNSSHPFENPTPLSNLLEVLAILLISAGLCYTFGQMVRDTRQGWAVLAAMLVIFVPLMFGVVAAEQSGNPVLTELGADQTASDTQPGGNMEGKEARFGIANSGLWAAATTAASNGSVNSMHDSYTPLGGLVPMWLMQLGEVVFGGVGSGLYGMLMFAVVAVFIAGLMVGRTPEYLGKKIEAYEMKMASLVLLIPPLVVLVGTAVASVVPQGVGSIANPDPAAHGFSEMLYAFSSAGNNNGSAFAGISANTPFYNTALGIAMWASRYWLMIPVLAIAGSLAAKRATAVTAGTLPTHGPLFVAMLVGVVLIVGALTFVPSLALGPIVEHLLLLGRG
jgi:K+-transporting ATPase ATPase A chain